MPTRLQMFEAAFEANLKPTQRQFSEFKAYCEVYLREHFGDKSEEQHDKLLSWLLPHLKQRWKQADFKKITFLKRNEELLSVEISFPDDG